MNNRYLIGLSILLSLALGATAMWGYQASTNRYAIHDPFPPELLDTPLLPGPQFPFDEVEDEIERFREQMDEALGRQPNFPSIGDWFTQPRDIQPFVTIRKEEDARYLFYVLDIKGKTLSNFEIETAGGYVSFNATLESKHPNLFSSSRISQRFPVPSSVDGASMQVEQLKDEIRVRFTKRG